jgi:hypothetical protein
MKLLKRQIRRAFNRFGLDLVRLQPRPTQNPDQQVVEFPCDFTPRDIAIMERVLPYTMTSPERLLSTVQAVRYVTENRIPGDFVECGVWRGGSVLAMLLTLLEYGVTDRKIHLFDTFEGMTEPTEADRDLMNEDAAAILARTERKAGMNVWCIASEQDVRQTVSIAGYPAENIHFAVGDVLKTIPEAAPERIALLRLDTDWYESTRHELIHLYPRLAPQGVLIIDDYGFWQGARQATDEFFATLDAKPLLHRSDFTGRCCIKPA